MRWTTFKYTDVGAELFAWKFLVQSFYEVLIKVASVVKEYMESEVCELRDLPGECDQVY